MRTVMREVPESYQTRCWRNGFYYVRCTKTRMVNRPQVEYYTERVPQVTEVCCDGYVDDGNDGCRPQCSEPCQHGRCVAPERCECDDGYGTLNGRYVSICRSSRSNSVHSNGEHKYVSLYKCMVSQTPNQLIYSYILTP